MLQQLQHFLLSQRDTTIYLDLPLAPWLWNQPFSGLSRVCCETLRFLGFWVDKPLLRVCVSAKCHTSTAWRSLQGYLRATSRARSLRNTKDERTIFVNFSRCPGRCCDFGRCCDVYWISWIYYKSDIHFSELESQIVSLLLLQVQLRPQKFIISLSKLFRIGSIIHPWSC